MITLKLNNYSEKDVEILQHALEKAMDYIQCSEYTPEIFCGCTVQQCETCTARTVCGDLNRAVKFLKSL